MPRIAECSSAVTWTTEGQQTFTANHLIEHCLGYAEGATLIALSLLEDQAQAE